MSIRHFLTLYIVKPLFSAGTSSQQSVMVVDVLSDQKSDVGAAGAPAAITKSVFESPPSWPSCMDLQTHMQVFLLHHLMVRYI